MWSILVNIFIVIGAAVSIIGACFLGFFGSIILYDLLDEQFKQFKFKWLKRDFRNEKKLYIMEQLEDLKKRYPDLEIDYKIK